MELKNAQADTLLNDIAIGATTGTLTGGNFGTPTTPIYLVFDYDVSAKYEVKLVTVAGANMTVMSHVSGADVAHTAGAKVGRMINVEIIDDLGTRDGWVKPDGVWARAGANSITVPTGAASIYAVGDKIKLTDTTTKYFYVTAVADTTLTVTAGSDNTVVGAISAYYYSHSNPVGFPFSGSPFRARATLASTLGTTANNAFTKVALDTETYDFAGNFASNKFTAPVTGYYDVKGYVEFDALAGASCLIGVAIYVDGAAVLKTYASVIGAAGAVTATDTIYLTAGQYVELFYYQNSGATTPDVIGGATSTFMAIRLI